MRRLTPIDSQGVKADSAHPPRLVWAAGVAVMVLAALVGLGIFIEKEPYGFDLWAYVLAGRHILAGEPLYPPHPQVPAGPLGEYHYAPIVAVPFVLLAPLPFALADAVWIGLNTGVAAAIGVHLIRPLPRDARPWAAAAFIFFLPTILEISLGNLNILTVALCLFAWSQRARPSVAGTVLAVAIGTKLLPLTLTLFYLGAGRIRIMGWTLGVGAAGLLVTALVFAREFPTYVAMLVAFKDSQWATEFIARASPAEIAAVLNSPVGVSLLSVIAVATAVVGGLGARRDPRDETHLHHLALAFAPYLAPFGLLWLPYLVFALPLLASTLHRALLLPGTLMRALLISALALSWLLMQLVGAEDEIMPIAAHFLGLLLLLALALAVFVLARREPSRESVPARVPA